MPSVWIDHTPTERQRHKQCAFNLYAAAMLEHALAPLCRAFGDASRTKAVRAVGRNLLAADGAAASGAASAGSSSTTCRG